MRTGTVLATTGAVTTGTAPPSPFFFVAAVDCFSEQAASWKTSRQAAAPASAEAKRVLARPENFNFIPPPKKAADSSIGRGTLPVCSDCFASGLHAPGDDAPSEAARVRPLPHRSGPSSCRSGVQYIEPCRSVEFITFQ